MDLVVAIAIHVCGICFQTAFENKLLFSSSNKELFKPGEILGKLGKMALWDLEIGEGNKNISQGCFLMINTPMIVSLLHVKGLLPGPDFSAH